MCTMLLEKPEGAQVKVYLKAVLLPQNGAVDWPDDSACVCTQIQTPHWTDWN